MTYLALYSFASVLVVYMANPCFIIVNYPDYASYPLLTVYIENKLDVQMLILPV